MLLKYCMVTNGKCVATLSQGNLSSAPFYQWHFLFMSVSSASPKISNFFFLSLMAKAKIGGKRGLLC